MEKQFKECVDIGTFILRQYKEVEEINRQRNDESKSSISFSDKGAEMSNMRESVRQYELQLADQKERYRQLKQRMGDAKQVIQEKEERAAYWENEYKQLV